MMEEIAKHSHNQEQSPEVQQIPEFLNLAPSHQAFAIALLRTSFNKRQAALLVHPSSTADAADKFAYRVSRDVRFKEFLQRVMEIRTSKDLSSIDWNREKSRKLSLINLEIIKERIYTTRREILELQESGSMNNNQERQLHSLHTQMMRWLRSAEFWKENLDRMHGYLSNTQDDNGQIKVIIRDLAELSDKELAILGKATRLTVLKDGSITELPPSGSK